MSPLKGTDAKRLMPLWTFIVASGGSRHFIPVRSHPLPIRQCVCRRPKRNCAACLIRA